jgi:hypothetical protein
VLDPPQWQRRVGAGERARPRHAVSGMGRARRRHAVRDLSALQRSRRYVSTVCREGFDAFAETERQIMADSPDPSVRLRALVRAYIHFATSNPAYFRIMFDSGFATACVARAMLRDCAVASRRAVDHGHDVFHQAFH